MNTGMYRLLAVLVSAQVGVMASDAQRTADDAVTVASPALSPRKVASLVLSPEKEDLLREVLLKKKHAKAREDMVLASHRYLKAMQQVRQRQANEAATRGFLARKAQAREAAAEREPLAQISEAPRAVMQDVVDLVAARLESAAAKHVVEEAAQQGEAAAAAIQESGEKEQPQESITDWVESFRSWAPEERDEVDRKAVNKKAAALRAARSHYVPCRVHFADDAGKRLEEVCTVSASGSIPESTTGSITDSTTAPGSDPKIELPTKSPIQVTSESTLQSGTQPATPRWSASMRGTVGGAGVLAALLLMAPELFSSKQRKKFGAIFSRNTKNKNTKTRLSSAQIGALVRVVAALAIGGVSATMAVRGRPDFWARA